MKRLVWLLIAVVCTALAQVQPVVMVAAPDTACCCTGGDAGACGMPDCAPAPSAPSCSPLPAAAAVQRTEARQLATAPRARVAYGSDLFSRRAPKSPVLRVSLQGTPAAIVPLFKAHCSFLI